MEKHKCKLCARMFGSGRALGGHMRSHFTILPLPTKTQLLSETPSSSDSEESEIELKSLHPLGSRRYRKRSGTELEKLVKKKKKKKKKSLTEQPVSSEPETCSEEDLAMWLLLLSRDKWVIKEQHPVQKSHMQNGTGDVRIHECPVCYKVFKSGQALGGHKRSHLLTSTAASVASSSAAHSSAANLWLLDLNLPAPLEDQDGQEISHTQIPVLC